ncbi:MAG: L,D-transpeptidase [Candidatus Nanopelagicales bacterium]
MPADADSLAALGELASAHHPDRAGHASRADGDRSDDQVTVAVARPVRREPWRAGPPLLTRTASTSGPALTLPPLRELPVRTRLAALAAASVAAGLVAGLVLPVASAQPAPATAARSVVVILPSARTPSPAPDAAAASRAARPAASSSARTVTAAAPLVTASPVDWSAAARGTASSAPAARSAAPAAAPAAPARTAAAAARGVAETVPARPVPGVVAAATAYKPAKRLPAASGTGRRIVYSQHKGHVWVVGADGAVVRDYPVTGRIGRPKPGTYHVFSKSPTSVNPKAKVRFDLMVRFAHGITGAAIGFHTIPRWYDGRLIQREDQLGEMIGAGGCVRQSKADARWLYRWSKVGDTVVVLR